MADQIIDILTRLSFESGDEQLNKVNTALGTQSNLVKELQDRLEKIDAMRKRSDQSVASVAKLNAEYNKTKTALESINTSYNAQSGIIGKLQEQQKKLQSQLTNAASREEIKRLNTELGNTERQLSKLGSLGKSGGPLANIGQSFAQGLGFAGGFGLVAMVGSAIGAVTAFGKASFKAAADFEQLSVAFTTLLGSQAKAGQLLSDLQSFAKTTPFQFTELTNLSKQLLAFGFSADEIIPTLTSLGNVASGLGADKLPQIVYAFAQIRANGRLTGQDLLQLVNAGFNPLQIISEKTGKSIAVLRKEMEKGNITFKDVEDAFKTATSAGGKFFNLMQNQSKTTAGAISNLGDAVDQFQIVLGSATTGPIKSFVLGLTDMVNAMTGYITLNPAEKLRQEQAAVNVLAQSIIDLNDNNLARNQLIGELNSKYPELLAGLSNEAISIGVINSRLYDYNLAMERRIALATKVAAKDAAAAKLQTALGETVDATTAKNAAKLAGINIEGTSSENIRAQLKVLRDRDEQTFNDLTRQLDAAGYGGGGLRNPFYVSIVLARVQTNLENNKKDIEPFAKTLTDLEAEISADSRTVVQEQQQKIKEAKEKRANLQKLKKSGLKSQLGTPVDFDQLIANEDTSIKGYEVELKRLEILEKKKGTAEEKITKAAKVKKKKVDKEDDAYLLSNIKKKSEMLEKETSQYALKVLKLEAQLAVDKLKINKDDLDAKIDLIKLQTRIEEEESNIKHDLLVAEAKRLFQDTARLEQAHKEEIDTIRAGGASRISDEQLKAAEKDLKALEKNLAKQIKQLKGAYAKEVEALDEKYKDQLITYEEYLAALEALKAKAENKAMVNKTLGVIDFTNQQISEAARAASEILSIEQTKNDALIEQQQHRVDNAKSIAQNGNAAILKAEEDRLEKLNRKQADYARKQRLINAILVTSQQAVNIANAIGAVLIAAKEGAAQGGYGIIGTTAAALIAIAAGVAAAYSTISSVNASGYKKGGYTGDGHEDEEAGPVHKKEYVFDAKSTARIGKERLEALRYGRLSVNDKGDLTDRQVDYAGMRQQGESIQQDRINAAFNTRALEKRIDTMSAAIVEAIDSIPGSSFHADADGLAARMWGHVKHTEKISRL